MHNRTIKVSINHVVVYEEIVRADRSMMRGHQLRKIFCIDLFKSSGIWAAVSQFSESGETELQNVQMEGSEIVAQSKMNDPNFMDSMDWFDEKIYDRGSEQSE